MEHCNFGTIYKADRLLLRSNNISVYCPRDNVPKPIRNICIFEKKSKFWKYLPDHLSFSAEEI